MGEPVFAELVLSLAIAPDRAAAVIGDLKEEGRGRFWFWWVVLGTAARHVWQDLRLHPGWAIGRASWGLGAWLVYSASLGMIVFAVRRFVPDPPSGYPSWQDPLTLTAIVLLFPLLMGWQNARRWPGRELASAAATTGVLACLYLLELYLSSLQEQRIGKPFPGVEVALPRLIAESFFTILGALLERWRTVQIFPTAALMKPSRFEALGSRLTRVSVWAFWAGIVEAVCTAFFYRPGTVTYFGNGYSYPPDGTSRITMALLLTLIPFLIGWGLARASKGHEWAAALVASLVVPLAAPRFAAIEQFFLIAPFVFAGAMLSRFSKPSRSRRASPPAPR